MVRRDSDYALRILAHMILSGAQVPLTGTKIARSAGIPESFAHKILRRLVAAGLLEARCGKGGGFVLTRRPRQIRMLDVITAAQGPLRISPCVSGRRECARRATCPMTVGWTKLQSRVKTLLGRTTLADILGPSVRRCAPRAGRTLLLQR